MNCRFSKRTRNTVNWHQLNQRMYWDFEISKVESWRFFLYTSKSLTTRTFQSYWKQNNGLSSFCSVLFVISILGYIISTGGGCMVSLTNSVYPPQYWWYQSKILNILQSTDGINQQYSIFFKVLMVWYPSTLLNILHSTDGINQQYSISSIVLMVSIYSTQYKVSQWNALIAHFDDSLVILQRKGKRG